MPQARPERGVRQRNRRDHPGLAGRVQSLDDLMPYRTGVVGVNVASGLAQKHGGLNMVTLPDLSAALTALTNREVDAILNATAAVREQIDLRGLQDSIVEVSPPFHTVPRAVALRFGLGSVRERLNAVMPAYLASSDYYALQRDWLFPQTAFDNLRITRGLFILTGLLCVVGLYAAYERRSRERHQREADIKASLLAQVQENGEIMKKMVTDLQRSNAELDGFAYIASHDLKAPLRVKRMENFLNDLLEHSRIGRVPVEDTIISGSELIDAVRDLAAVPDAFTFDVDPGFQDIFLPVMPIRTVLVNLVSNAVKHHDRPDGTIHISVSEGAEGFTFTVEDDGPGIPREYHEKVFQMFQTLKPRDTVEGSGMGLAMVQKTVLLEGGSIDLASDAGTGARFVVHWPKHQDVTDCKEKAA